ncbi:hypothetical protein [Pedobacter metabolipauper]|uniref:Lipoprotein n=1 Tax=Pedobacter metabolipauper TaxID=425513 RepID=A0A4V3D1Q9_9SPHI|nr:hypothetical protein [Pedobacter metabolipauper]TDQ12153.1 hypothetical protein ATK78_1285 [Pedobacter metabolipauper]
MRIVFILWIMIILSGCGTFRKVFKTKELKKVESSTTLKKDSTGLTIDKTKITTVEKIDTAVVVPEKTVTQDTYLNMDSIVNGIMAIKSDLVDVKLMLDPVTGILTTKATVHPNKIPFKFDRTTTVLNDITQQSSSNSNQKEEKTSLEKNSTVQKEPAKMGVWLVAFFVVVLAVLFMVKMSKPKI